MHRTFTLTVLLVQSVSAAAQGKTPAKPCAIHSSSTGSYYDLTPLDLSLPSNAKVRDARKQSWYAKGHDYPSNFSLNICGPVVEPLEHVKGLPPIAWGNVSAFYESEDDGIQSIGQSNSELVFRGRKLLLNYTGGSPCPALNEDGDPVARHSFQLDSQTDIEEGDGWSGMERLDTPSAAASTRRKSSLLSLQCDRDPSVSTNPSLSFLGTLDHCTYFFEAHSRYFCGGAASSPEPGSLGPGGVFGVIIVVALLTYLVAGCAYRRVVMQQRGWRQCPTYGLWTASWQFMRVSD